MTPKDVNLVGKRILVVEDDHLIAKYLVRDLRNLGVDVLGPAPTVAEALHLAQSGQVDGAVLDVNLRGDMAYPVIDLLLAHGVPLVLTTGYSVGALPMRYRTLPCCVKRVEPDALARALFPN